MRTEWHGFEYNYEYEAHIMSTLIHAFDKLNIGPYFKDGTAWRYVRAHSIDTREERCTKWSNK